MLIKLILFLSFINIFVITPLFIYIHNKYIKKFITIPLFVFMMLIIVYPVRAFIIYFDQAHSIIPYLYEYNESIFSEMLLYANLSIIFFFLGSFIVFTLKTSYVNIYSRIDYLKLYKKTYLINILLFFMLFFYSLNMLNEMRQFGNVKEAILSGKNIYFSLLFSIKTYILIFFCFYYFNYRMGKYIFYTVLILSLIEALISGSKSSFIINLIIVLLLYKQGKMKIRYLYFFIAFIILIFVSVIATIVRFYVTTQGNFFDIVNFIINNFNYSFFFMALNTLTHRFHGIDSLYDIYFYLQHNSLLYGKSLMLFFYAFYPRILWLNKPDIAMGVWFGNNVFEVKDTTVAFWIPGEAFLNFGFLGIILVFLYSMWLAYLDKKFHNNMNLFVIMMYISMFLTIKNHEYTIAAAMSGLIKNLIPVFLYISILIIFYKIRLKH